MQRQTVKAIQVIDSMGLILATEQGRWDDAETAIRRMHGYHPSLFSETSITIGVEQHGETLVIQTAPRHPMAI